MSLLYKYKEHDGSLYRKNRFTGRVEIMNTFGEWKDLERLRREYKDRYLPMRAEYKYE